ncbi:MAG: maleylacetoacetate isomerase [Pseudomonas sp.]|nr:maleylacetoacetate isomerase [Pseudomonas sp.]
MQLYTFFNSSTSYRVRIALALKGLCYQHHGVNIRVGEQDEQSYLVLNPSASVPLLIDDDGTRVSQSLAIIDYLEHAYPDSPRLLPEVLAQRSWVLQVANLVACDIHPLNNLRVLNYLAQHLNLDAQQRSVWYRHWIDQGMQALEAMLQGAPEHGPYCLGQVATLADCCLVPQVANALRMGCDLSAYPRTLAVYEHCQRQPDFQKAAPERQLDFTV